MLTDLKKKFPRLKTITAMFADSNGMMRGKILPVSSLDKLVKDGVLFAESIFGTDSTGESVSETGLIWETGDSDFPCHVVEGSFFELAGSDGREAACLVSMLDETGAPHRLDPRNILGRAVKRLEKQGIYAQVAPELEFYLIARRLDASGMGQGAIAPQDDRPQATNQIYGIDAYDEFAPVLEAIYHASMMANIQADTTITEYGRGQYEINIQHHADVVRAADEAALFRYLARRVARHQGFDVTFMGKPFANDTGNGFHLHASLWNSKGENLMAEGKGETMISNPTLLYAVGGMTRHLGDSMAVFSPNANAWRRTAPGNYAPVDKSWGINNRTVNFRVPESGAKARRLEHRASSADINPYLTTTLILAAMAEGIKGKIPPPPITEGNAYAAPQREGLPRTWGEANEMFRASSFITDWLGADYANTYYETKEYERRTFEAVISPLEWSWYR